MTQSTYQQHIPPGDASEQLLQNVSEALKVHASKTVFTIGGKLKASSYPVTLRWDSTKATASNVVHLPIESDADKVAFDQLLIDCEPALFGKGGENVLDETYRKAGDMDSSRICTSFNLAETSIMDTISQVLGQSDQTRQIGGVRAQLYKLNVSVG